MQDNCISPDAAALARALADTAARHRLALGGGACALRLGHRISRDLDFFALGALDPPRLLGELAGFERQRLRGISHAELVVVVNGAQVSATSLGREPLDATDRGMGSPSSPGSTSPSSRSRLQLVGACSAISAT
jgi:hypothetical protein